MHKLFYPKEWLDATGFWNAAINKGDNVIMFQPAKVTYESNVLAFTIVVSSVIALLVGNTNTIIIILNLITIIISRILRC